MATNGYLDYLYDELTYDEFLDKVQERDDAYTVAFDAWEDLAAEHDFDPYDCDGLRIPKPTPFPTWTPLPVSAAVPTSSPTPSAPSFSGEVFVYLYNNLDHSVKLALWGVIEREVNVEAGEVLTTLVPSGSYSFKVFGIEGCETLAETETIPDNHYLAIYFDPDPTAPNPPCLWEWDFAVARE